MLYFEFRVFAVGDDRTGYQTRNCADVVHCEVEKFVCNSTIANKIVANEVKGRTRHTNGMNALFSSVDASVCDAKQSFNSTLIKVIGTVASAGVILSFICANYRVSFTITVARRTSYDCKYAMVCQSDSKVF